MKKLFSILPIVVLLSSCGGDGKDISTDPAPSPDANAIDPAPSPDANATDPAPSPGEGENVLPPLPAEGETDPGSLETNATDPGSEGNATDPGDSAPDSGADEGSEGVGEPE